MTGHAYILLCISALIAQLDTFTSKCVEISVKHLILHYGPDRLELS